MPRLPKLRKKNSYWMTKAGGTETYFGKVAAFPAEQAFRMILSVGPKPLLDAEPFCNELFPRASPQCSGLPAWLRLPGSGDPERRATSQDERTAGEAQARSACGHAHSPQR